MTQRILFTIPNFDTAGSGKALLNVASRLDPVEFEPHIACLHDRGAFFQVVKDSGIPVHVFSFVSPARPFSTLFQSSWAVSRRFRAINPNLIHSFHYAADYTEALAATLARIPWVFTKKNMNWGGGSANGWRLRSYLASGIAVQNSDMERQFYPGSRKTMRVSRGVNVEEFTPAARDPAIRESLDTPPDARVLICVANLVPVKGIDLLLEAFSRLRETAPDWYLWIVGDDKNDYGEAMHARSKELALEDRVRFSGKRPKVRAYLDHAEVFVLPTRDEGRREGSPVATLEAMANEKVVLGAAVPGIRDQFSENPENLFEPGNVNALTDRLRPLLTRSTNENRTAGTAFRRLAETRFTIAGEVERHQHFYRQVLSGWRAPPVA